MSTMTHDDPQALPHREVLQVMTGLLAALFTALISNTIVSTALPTIMADLNGTQRQYTWVITASLLTMTVSTAIWGKMSDLFNKKLLVQISIILFVAASIVAGLSTNIATLMGARAFQGIAMGGLMAMVQSIMATIIAPRQRGRYAGYMGGVMGIATVSGPLLGGVITDGLGWRWTYFVSVPLAVVALVLIQSKLHLPTVAARKVTIDYAGAVLLTIAAALPMLWVTFAGSSFAWISWESGAYVASFLVAVALTVVVELRAPEPIVPIRLLRNNTATLMIVASIAVGVAMFGPAVFLTQYFQLGEGYSPTQAGLLILPMIITQTASSAIGGQIVSRTGRWKPIMVVGSFLMVIGLGGLGMVDHTTGYTWVALSMATMGIGVGTLIQNIVLAVQNTVDVTDVGAASASIAFFRSLGGAIGVSALGAVLTNQVGSEISERLTRMGVPADAMGGDSGETDLDLGALPAPIRAVVQDAYADSFGHVFLIATAVAVITLVAVLLVRGTPLRTTVALRPSTASPAPTAAAAVTSTSGPSAPQDDSSEGTHPEAPSSPASMH
ncbi:MDR family MFS transporter [Janibacter cremeus]|uniref:EmrB/QacA subfamily drug resistance transporter n=1 Tax=Janibacter cremeus TaxID=1285192 RepID=A0A852VLM4_9MICO|nr:MDR family MFS transporter [Janibacter cremeus]NYF97977.1 EmrB/QacA subfamily drug resistance transporter [Janibacter cremeus]